MFKKYNSIENIDNGKLVDKVRYEGFTDPSIQWIAQEKIHGANFSFMYDGKTLSCAKRTGDITETENFFGYEIILTKYKKSVMDAWDLLNERYKDVKEINIFGEFAEPGIQKEVDYEHKDFYAFDIQVNGNYIDKEIVNETCKLSGIKIAPIIRYGSFDELCNMERAFDTLVPKYNEMLTKTTDAYDFIFGEQEAGKDNIAEGFVIAPIIPSFLMATVLSLNVKMSYLKRKVK
jgi:Rnl2 family RNA ligase